MTSEPRALQALVFDFDGVLADTERLHLLAFRQVLEPLGCSIDTAEYYERYLGFDDVGAFGAIAQDRGLAWTTNDVTELVNAKAACFRQILDTQPVLFDGVRELVPGWAREVPVAIASGALRAEIELIVAAGGLGDVFPVIVAAGETVNFKPEPDPYLAALARLGVDPARSVAVEDSLWGIESARRAGMKVVAVTTSYPRERLTAADAVVSSFSELTMELFEALVRRGQEASANRQ
jgi:beta-phosphoglucomutase